MNKDNEIINYIDAIENDDEFSLNVDPTNKYLFKEEERKFIELYIEYKNLNIVSSIMLVPLEQLISYLNNYNIKQEIRRINRAQYHHQFKNKMLSLEEIGGYLTSLIMDDKVSETDKLSTRDKVSVAKTLIDIHKLKEESKQSPSVILNAEIKTIENDIKDLSISTIKTMIEENTKKQNDDVKNLVDTTFSRLTPEEESYLKSLSKEELLKLLKK